MNGFSGFGNSPAKQQDPLEKKLVSQEFDLTKNENKLDGDKTSSKDSIIKSPDKDKTSPAKQKRVPKKEETLERKMDKATKFKGTKTLTKKFHPRDYQKNHKKLPSSSNLDPQKK